MSANNRFANRFSLRTNWDTYWFYPAPLFNLAMCRMIIVGYQLGYLFVRDYWDKVLTQASLPTVEFTALPIFKLLNLLFPWEVPPIAFLMAVFVATIAAGILAFIGLKTRLSLLVFALGNLYIQTYLYSFGKVHHSQAVMLITLLLFTLAPVGATLSVDDLSQRLSRNVRRRQFQAFSVLRGESAFARWPLLLVQWLFAFIYLSAALNKLDVDGAGLISSDWMNGYTLRYYLVRDGSQWGSDLGVWLGQFHVLAMIASWVAVCFEATFFLTLVFPRLIWVYIPLGAMFHTGIWMAQRAPFFQYVAIYAVFIPWTVVIKRLANWLKWSAPPRKAELFYDGLSAGGIRTLTALCYFDWFQRVAYRDLGADGTDLAERLSLEKRSETACSSSKLYLVEPDGTVQVGFFALRQVMAYLPPLWPLRSLMFFPGVSAIGSKVYASATAP